MPTSDDFKERVNKAIVPIGANDALPFVLFGFSSWFLIALATPALSSLPDRAKSRFLANLSHEIRTPLNAIIAIEKLLKFSKDADEIEEYTDAIGAASASLLMLVNDVLDISKIEAGELLVEQREFSLRQVLDGIEDLFSAMAHNKGVALKIASPADTIADRLVGDETHLRQILSNLVSNAIKFTPQGEVRVECRQTDPSEADSVRLLFVVSDTGIGISEAALERVFQPFTQADESTRRSFGGTGLGLALVKQLSEACGGATRLQSTLGAGTRIEVELPFAVAAPSDRDALEQRGNALEHLTLSGLRILIVDDTPMNLTIARKLVERAGARSDAAENGLIALEKIEQNPQAYHVVLLDMQMPVMDGYETCRRLRENPLTSALPVIAVTAAATASDREAAYAAGVNAYETKPIHIDRLVNTIKRVLLA